MSTHEDDTPEQIAYQEGRAETAKDLAALHARVRELEEAWACQHCGADRTHPHADTCLGLPQEFPCHDDEHGDYPEGPPGPGSIPLAVANRVFGALRHQCDSHATLAKMAKGTQDDSPGFSWAEMDAVYPAWREECDEFAALKAKLAESEAAFIERSNAYEDLNTELNRALERETHLEVGLAGTELNLGLALRVADKEKGRGDNFTALRARADALAAAVTDAAIWSKEPPTEPGRYWKSVQYECNKCWTEPIIASLEEADTYTVGNRHLVEMAKFASPLPILIRRDTSWGPRLPDEVPPPLTGEDE